MRHRAWVADSSSAGDGDGNEEVCSEVGGDDMRRSLAPIVRRGHEKLQGRFQMKTAATQTPGSKHPRIDAPA